MTGIVPIPDTATEDLVGGHALNLVGWNDNTNRFIVQNSWNSAWGDKGYCYIPYDYILDPNLSDDFWTITFFS
jgi:C1A family cysteine protease